MRLLPSNARLPELLKELYALNAVGGPLHIIVDDFNVDDSHLEYCERTLAEHWSIQTAGPEEAQALRSVSQLILAALWPMTPAQREEALREYS